MNLLYELNGSWVAASNKIQGNPSDLVVDLVQRVKGVGPWLFDLDDNHARSPAKSIVRQAIGTDHLSPRYLSWAMRTLSELVRNGKAAESQAWEQYVDSFLQTERAKREIEFLVQPKVMNQALYTGVKDFCREVRSSTKFYITRNIAQVANAYATYLGLDGAVAEVNDKGRQAELMVLGHPFVEHFGVSGDSDEDVAMVEEIQVMDQNVISLYSMAKPGDIHPTFDYGVSKDLTALVELLRNN
ncbi:MAG: hypothetical protein CMH61_02855 [Nanoarchaeota archaeon]|nr:hypothetical protein [Nanoarchaeota archaeon]|tara:strand:+ start:1886 stop:2614 length:729 start_codon:yes stop_codon:yes gene_type:complete